MPNKRGEFCLVFLLILTLKLCFLWLYGAGFETDSWNYLSNILSFDYPPLYPYFLYFLGQISTSIYLIVIVQVIIFSLCAAVFTFYFFARGKEILLFAFIAGIEPSSGYYASTIMSEAIFIPLLLLFFVILHFTLKNKNASVWHFMALGTSVALLYASRFSALLLFPPILILFTFQKNKLKLLIQNLFFFILSFQVILLPLRYKYKVNFQTLSFNAFSGRLLWNNASAIYLNSELKRHPQNEFEKYLSVLPEYKFSTQLAIRGRQLWDDSLALRSYQQLKKMSFSDMPGYNRMVGQTASKLILENPSLYLGNFVIPHIKKLLSAEDPIYPAPYAQKIQEVYKFKIFPRIEFHHGLFLVYLVLFALINIWILFQREKNKSSKLMLFMCWCYFLILPFVSIPDSRLYLVFFLPMLAAWMVELVSFKALSNEPISNL